MAFDLVAKLKLDDRLSGPLKKATATTRMMNSTLGTTSRSLLRTETSAKGAASALSRVGSSGVGFGSIVKGAGAIAVAMGGAKLAAEGFNATIGAAAKLEMSKVTATSMFNGDTKGAKVYFDYIQKRAVESFFSVSDFFATSKSFIAITKNEKSLEGLTNIAERLAASDPAQGLEGAAISLREMFSGDTTSLAERFEIPRSTLNMLKSLPLDKQISGMDKLLNKMGITNKLLEDQGTTALGLYSQSVDKVHNALTEMGTKGLDRLKPSLEKVNKWLDGPQFAQFAAEGTRAFDKFATSATTAINRAASYIETNYLNNPAFKSLDMNGKVSFVIDDIGDILETWLNSEQAKKIATTAGTIGSTLVSSAGSAAFTALKENPTLALLLGGYLGLRSGPLTIPVLVSAGLVTSGSWAVDKFKDFVGDTGSGVRKLVKSVDDSVFGTKSYRGTKSASNVMTQEKNILKREGADFLESHAPSLFTPQKRSSGLDYVPRDNMPVLVHRGERIQTKTQADADRAGRGKGGVVVNVQTLNVRQESDIDAIAMKLARYIEMNEGAASVG